MSGFDCSKIRRKRTVARGGGIVSSVLNKAIDLLPVELHIPGYQYCGPGTKLRKRLARGDPGINKLDQACKTHDIAYSRYKDSENRRRADQELAERAWQRFKAADSSVGEKAAAWAVTTAMKAKSKFGGGRKKKKRAPKRKGKGLYIRPYTRKQGSGKKKKRTGKKKKTSKSR
jgi:hypothetical protein